MDQLPTILQGDAEAAVVDILLNMTPELSAAQVTISTNMIGYDTSKRWVMVILEGAIDKYPGVLYRPRIDLDVYAEKRSTALDITQWCIASLRRTAGTYDDFGFRYTGMHVESGPVRIPDVLEESVRFVASIRLYGRAGVPLSPPS